MAWYPAKIGGGSNNGVDLMFIASNQANLTSGKVQVATNDCIMDTSQTDACPWNAGAKSTYIAFTTSKTKFVAYVLLRAQQSSLANAGTDWYPICQNATIDSVEYPCNTVVKTAKITVTVTDPSSIVKIGMYTRYSALDLLGLAIE